MIWKDHGSASSGKVSYNLEVFPQRSLSDTTLSSSFNNTLRAAEMAEMLRAPSATSKNQVQCLALISKGADTVMPLPQHICTAGAVLR